MFPAPLELGMHSEVTIPEPSVAALLGAAASAKEVGAMLFLDDIGAMLSIAGASFAGAAVCSALLLLLA